MSPALSQLVETAQRETPLRANSLLITLFGDAIAPHGGSLWLGSLIELVAPLGLNDRLVRTTVFRLVQEDWLTSTPLGRRSLYRLTETGLRRIEHAYQRVYARPEVAWNGRWQLAIVPDGTLPPKERDALRKHLLWEGFGAIAAGIFAHPSGDTDRLREILKQTDCGQKLAIFEATEPDGIASVPVRTLVEQCWHLDELAADYQRFVSRFSPMLCALRQNSSHDPEQSFIIRTLLIHEFRRIQLRDPQLPDGLLAANWPGHIARQLCIELYEMTLEASERHLMTTLKTNGTLPAANGSLFRKFGETPRR